jgi:hypothetical protein
VLCGRDAYIEFAQRVYAVEGCGKTGLAAANRPDRAMVGQAAGIVAMPEMKEAQQKIRCIDLVLNERAQRVDLGTWDRISCMATLTGSCRNQRARFCQDRMRPRLVLRGTVHQQHVLIDLQGGFLLDGAILRYAELG